MDNYDKLAKRMNESDESLSRRKNMQAISPVAQLIAKARVRWPFPEMGEMEYVDWLETLSLFPPNELQMALDYIMRNPPKRDGVEYRGRPSLVDVTRTIDILREEKSSERMRNEGKRITDEMRKLQADRDAHPEKYFGLADVFRTAKISDLKTVVKPTPEVKTVWPEIDPTGANAEKLKRQKEALERQERARASAGDRDE